MRLTRNKRLFFWGAVLACLVGGGLWVLTTFAREEAHGLLIGEFVAANQTGLVDEDGDYSDWIELYNGGSQAVNLSGWSLTDDPAQPRKWLFPNMSLGSGQRLVVFASGKDRRLAAEALHTNFKLSREGEFLGLYSLIRGQMVDSVTFPEQFVDMAYGRQPGQTAYVYLAMPSPGRANDASRAWAGQVEPVHFSPERGFYDRPFSVALSTTTPEATIYYTTDGSQPGRSNGLVYRGPIAVEGTTPLRAVALRPGFLPSATATHTYLFLDQVLRQPAQPPGFPTTWGMHVKDIAGYEAGTPAQADYEMDPDIVNHPDYRATIKEDLRAIPSLSIVTGMPNFTIYGSPRERGMEWERPVSVELIYPHGEQAGFQVGAGLRIQGGVGRWEYMPKHSFRLFFRSEYGPTRLNYPLFPDSPVESFETLVLRGGANRSYAGKPDPGENHRLAVYTRDEWLRASQVAMWGVGSHGIFVHLYLNGLYWGLYNVVERPDAAFLAAYRGGDEQDWVALKHGFSLSGTDYLPGEVINGSRERFDELQAIAAEGGLADPARYEMVQSYLDIPQFVDYVILNWYAGNKDWPHHNWYTGYKAPDGPFLYFAWDGENSWIDGARLHLGRTDDPGRFNPVKPLFEALAENPDFRMCLADRLYEQLFNQGALTDARAMARWRELNEPIERAIVGESARWGDARYETPITRRDWLQARDEVLAQMEGNGARLLRAARRAGYYPPLDPPRFSREGGLITPGFGLAMDGDQEATIYYTTDGSDPRLAVTGAVASTARVYGAPLVLTATTTVQARAKVGDTWSALHRAAFRLVERESGLRISEIMYNPVGGQQYEFVELYNAGEAPLDLANLSFEGIRFTFPPHMADLAPGRFVVLARNAAAFAERYPAVMVAGVYDGQLSNRGERLVLKDEAGQELLAVAYDDENGWPISPDGRGDSLVLVDPAGDPNDPRSWRASVTLHGSPGQ